MRDFNASYSRLVASELATAEKGIPVPHTGYQRRYKYYNGSGVSASSRVLQHYYATEGDKGRWVRKVVRNRERQMWRDEWENERNACEGYDMDGCDVRDWFESAELQWEWYEDYNPWDDDCQICGGECRL